MREILAKITEARTSLLVENPFYGHILLKMRFGIASCGTACTDGKRILFDVQFAKKLSLKEMTFVIQHEVLHCILQHLTRSKEYNRHLYNIAADIVINSTILKERGQMDFTVEGEVPIHTVPDGREGYLFTTEQVYKLLRDQYGGESVNVVGDILDNHTIWERIPLSMCELLEDEWQQILTDMEKKLGDADIPPVVREFIQELEYQSRIDWRNVLREFVQSVKEHYGYSFSPPDRRFTNSNFILPAFRQCTGEKVEDIWFLVDASGSIDVETFSMFYEEIRACINQFEGVRGKLAFFDTQIREEYEFETIDDLENIQPSGGGGTSFHCIFEYMKETMIDKLPAAIVILTDGCAQFPTEDEIEIMSEKVLWIIVEHKIKPPWGKVVYVEE